MNFLVMQVNTPTKLPGTNKFMNPLNLIDLIDPQTGQKLDDVSGAIITLDAPTRQAWAEIKQIGGQSHRVPLVGVMIAEKPLPEVEEEAAEPATEESAG